VKARGIRKAIARHKCCKEVKQKGSHIVIRCECTDDEEGTTVCITVVPDHGAKDLGAGLLRAIERDLEPCLGKGWLK
jgi:predicted RNA binding protein YcfA (HicA-like mRNA interferase family)